MVSSEIVDASNLLLACPELAGHSAMYADRPCPVFSKVAAILSHIENKALMVLRDKVRGGEARGGRDRGELHRWRGVRD